MKAFISGSALLLALAGCAVQQNLTPAKPGLNAWDAIVLSEQAAPQAVPGLFSLQIRNTDRVGEVVYLNTELDYRDRRNVTVLLTRQVMQEFAKQYPDQQPEQYFLGRSIVINGAAVRRTIWFFSDGKQTEKYYFQTHIPIFQAGQILSPLTAKAYWQQNKKLSEQATSTVSAEASATTQQSTAVQ